MGNMRYSRIYDFAADGAMWWLHRLMHRDVLREIAMVLRFVGDALNPAPTELGLFGNSPTLAHVKSRSMVKPRDICLKTLGGLMQSFGEIGFVKI